MERSHLRTGERLTYERLAARAGLSRATIEALASRSGYNTTLGTIEKLCRALDCTPGDLLELLPNGSGEGVRQRTASRKRPRNLKHGAAGRSATRR